MLYDQYVYALIFWTASGRRGIPQSEKSQDSTTVIPRVLIYLIFQPIDHFICQLNNLREEFICDVYGRLINVGIKCRAQAE
jgi:uncharacterized circularly permuted ATP-grasp superfamily protein